MEPVDKTLEGKSLLLLGHMVFAGGTISTLQFGNHKVQILNSSLRIAHEQADEVLYSEDT